MHKNVLLCLFSIMSQLLALQNLCRKVIKTSLFTSSVSTKTNDLTYDLASWKNGFTTCEKEICEVLDGSVPVDLEGTYFRNGYGKFEIGKEPVLHPFDADGMMCAITIEKGRAIFRNRFIQTKGFKKEKRFRKIQFRGAFGTQRAGGFMANILDTKIKNVANTNVLWWGNRLLALWEGGLPHKMEPGIKFLALSENNINLHRITSLVDSLRTLTEYTLQGLLDKKSGMLFTYLEYNLL